MRVADGSIDDPGSPGSPLGLARPRDRGARGWDLGERRAGGLYARIYVPGAKSSLLITCNRSQLPNTRLGPLVHATTHHTRHGEGAVACGVPVSVPSACCTGRLPSRLACKTRARRPHASRQAAQRHC
eukprot:scaffold20786_cov68-Phaeocystis_antarctica.AAC.4